MSIKSERLEQIMNFVIPDQFLIYRDSGSWQVNTGNGFDWGEPPYFTQNANEEFGHFIDRFVLWLLESEHSLDVGINYAIYVTGAGLGTIEDLKTEKL